MSHKAVTNRYMLKKYFPLISWRWKKVIDFGCGKGEWGFLIKTHIEPNVWITGIDIHKKYLDLLSKFKIYDKIINADFLKYDFNEKFDVALMMEVLEHLSFEEGLKLIKIARDCTKEAIFISTPINEPQDAMEDNPREKHISEWDCPILESLGFKILENFRMPLLPRSLRFFDDVRRIIFCLPKPRKIIAWLKLNG